MYREAIAEPAHQTGASLCEIVDKKRQTVGWGIYSPEGPLALRVISIDKKPPGRGYFEKIMGAAWLLRASLRGKDTSAYRLFNGEGDGLPGMVCDVYDSVAVLQFDGPHCFDFWDQEFVAGWLLSKESIETVYQKPRRSESREARTWGAPLQQDVVTIKENGAVFHVNIVDGQKTGFFLDQRDNRQYLKTIARDQKVLNLFSYTGGFSIYAGLGDAREVTSVDLSAPALELADQSWIANGLPKSQHRSQAVDVFDFVEKAQEKWDIVMVDPPSMSHSEKTKPQAVKSYTDLFAQSARLVGKGKHLILSSCSSHISSEDFLNIADEALSQARRTGKILRISGQGMDHPFPHFCRELRYLKFVHIVLN